MEGEENVRGVPNYDKELFQSPKIDVSDNESCSFYVSLVSAAPHLQTAPDFSPPYFCTLTTAEKTTTQTFHTKTAHANSCRHLHDQIRHVYNALQSTRIVWHPVKCLTINSLS